MNTLSVLFGVAGLFAAIFLLYIFATLSRRLGAVTKMKPYYRGFYVAMILIGAAIVAGLTYNGDRTGDLLIYLFVYYLPLVLAGVISLIVALRYWGWLFRERMK
jgi:hypothetical protein